MTAEDGQFEDAVVTGYTGICSETEAVFEARVVIEASMAPATRKVLLPPIAELWETTTHAQSVGDNLKLKFAGYCRTLQEYPADVALEAIERWGRREKWWPARSEMIEECNRLVNWRRVTRDALGRVLK